MSSKAPINWWGGKHYIADKIIKLFPPHQVYVEVFGGAGQILFKKPPSPVEVYNDIDSMLVSFFRLLRDDKKFARFHQLLTLTPYSREEFYHCRDTWESETDEVKKIWKWYVTIMQSYSNNGATWGHTKSFSRRGMSASVSRWLNKVDKVLPQAVERLRKVQIENLDFREIIPKYDSEDTLLYCDPPYVHSTRTMSYTYKYEMDDKDHEELVELLKNIKGKAILSGYDNDIYKKLNWNKIDLGYFAKYGMPGKKEKGHEFVWINF